MSFFQKLKRKLRSKDSSESGGSYKLWKGSTNPSRCAVVEQHSMFLLLPKDILNYLMTFLSWRDLYRIALTCRKMSTIVRNYFDHIYVDFEWTDAPGFDVTSDRRMVRRVKPSADKANSTSGLWRQIRSKVHFERGTFYWRLRICSDRSDGNDWKLCVGVAGQVDEKRNPTYDRWFGGNCVAYGMQIGSGRLVSGTPSGGTVEGSELKNKATQNGDLVGVALDLATDNCTVAFYINHKFAGKHTFLKHNIPNGRLWPIVTCSSGSHQAEVLSKSLDLKLISTTSTQQNSFNHSNSNLSIFSTIRP